MSMYVPTTERVKLRYAFATTYLTHKDPKRVREEFDRWLAEHDRQVKADAWEFGYLTAATRGETNTINPYRDYSEPNSHLIELNANVRADVTKGKKDA